MKVEKFLVWAVLTHDPLLDQFLESTYDDLYVSISTTQTDDEIPHVTFLVEIKKNGKVIDVIPHLTTPQRALEEAELWVQNAVVGRVTGEPIEPDKPQK